MDVSRRIHRGRRVGRAREPPDIKAPREVISEGKLVLNGRKRRGDELDLDLHWGRGGVGGQRKGNRVVAREGLRERKTFSKGSGRKIEEERSKRKPRGESGKRFPLEERGFTGKFSKILEMTKWTTQVIAVPSLLLLLEGDTA